MADNFKVRIQFAGLPAGQAPPDTALYHVDVTGRPVAKLGSLKGDAIEIKGEWAKLPGIALGPDVEDFASLASESLVTYRYDSIAPVWQQTGIVIGPDLWERFFFETVCVTGRARKCRPWWWRRIEQIDTLAGVGLTRAITQQTLADRPDLQVLLPMTCLALCDGIVEVHERICCCKTYRIPDLIDRLWEVIKLIPIPIPDPPPIRTPDVAGPVTAPGAALDLTPLPGGLSQLASLRPTAALPRAAASSAAGLRAQTRNARRQITKSALGAPVPAERLYNDYVTLIGLGQAEAQQYVLQRPYLIGFICSCSQRQVGEMPLQPGGRFDFCYRRPRRPAAASLSCYTSHAYRVRQLIQGTWVTVYDGVAAHDWFASGESGDLRTSDWRAKVCGSGPGDAPPGDGTLPFVMLEHVGGATTHHFNFPAQGGVSQLAALGANAGTYTTSYAPDCPWGGSLGLRLWVSPEMEPIARYYRLSIVPLADTGLPSGAVTVLDAPVSWNRFVSIGGEWVSVPEVLSMNPADVGNQQGLVRIPYWSGGNHWLSGQFHQVWNTVLNDSGKYMLIVELFDAAGARIKPASAPPANPGAARPFQFRRWRQGNPNATDNVAFADLAHAFWIDNTVVEGDVVDFRKNGVASSEECQFISGPEATTVSVGFRAYHDLGVFNPTNTFMRSYSLTWQRGLNGPSGSFASGTSDVGEPPAGPEASSTLTIAQLLGPWPGFPSSHEKCTFSVHLHVQAKHFNGSGRLSGYDYHESASFALLKTP